MYVLCSWVNGSDPRLQQQLFEFKRDMGLLTEEEVDDAKRTVEELKTLQEHNSQSKQHLISPLLLLPRCQLVLRALALSVGLVHALK